MAYIGKPPAPAAFTSDDLSDNIVVTGKIADGTITNADITTANADRIAHTKITPPQYASLSALNSSYAASADNHGALAHAHAEGKVYFSHDDGSGYAWHPLANEDAELLAIGALAKTDGNIIVGNGSTWVAESGATARASLGLAIGTDVQAYNASLADLTADQTFTGQNRGGITALSNNTNTFNLTNTGIATNNFSVIFTTGSPVLNFTIDANSVGQSGNIVFTNGDGSTNATAFSAGSTFKIASADLITLAAAGTYWMSYICISTTQVLVTISAKLY